MPTIPTDADATNWHRYFAINANNRAWDLTAKDRTDVEDVEMLNAAHASSFHWSLIGTELHKMRSKTLLSRVHTLVGNAGLALKLASEMRDYFTARETPHWELAFAHGIYAHAALLAGDHDQHRIAYQMALSALSAVTSEEEKVLIRETLDRVPSP